MGLGTMQKAKTHPVARLRRQSPERRRLLLSASTLLTVASAAVAALPFRKAIRFGSVPIGRETPLILDDLVWAIEAAARHLPWRTLCIEQGLAGQRLLRRRGVDASLHYGIRHHPESDKLEAHVWVTVNGRPIIGGEEVPGFAEVARYP